MEMESGYLYAPLHYGRHSMKWSQEPRPLLFGGEVLYNPRQGGKCVFKAHRCQCCTIVAFDYEQHSKGIGP